jgi:hypothetical protein
VKRVEKKRLEELRREGILDEDEELFDFDEDTEEPKT